jgi:hypothetical protein
MQKLKDKINRNKEEAKKYFLDLKIKNS